MSYIQQGAAPGAVMTVGVVVDLSAFTAGWTISKRICSTWEQELSDENKQRSECVKDDRHWQKIVHRVAPLTADFRSNVDSTVFADI